MTKCKIYFTLSRIYFTKEFGGSIMDTVISALITGGLALIGVIVTNVVSNRRVESQLQTSQAVTDTKLDALTEEVKKHNNFASRIPVIENNIENLDKRVQKLEA